MFPTFSVSRRQPYYNTTSSTQCQALFSNFFRNFFQTFSVHIFDINADTTLQIRIFQTCFNFFCFCVLIRGKIFFFSLSLYALRFTLYALFFKLFSLHFSLYTFLFTLFSLRFYLLRLYLLRLSVFSFQCLIQGSDFCVICLISAT